MQLRQHDDHLAQVGAMPLQDVLRQQRQWVLMVGHQQWRGNRCASHRYDALNSDAGNLD